MDIVGKTTLFDAMANVDALETRDGVNTQQVDEALTCLTKAFGADVHDAELKQQLATDSDISFDKICNGAQGA